MNMVKLLAGFERLLRLSSLALSLLGGLALLVILVLTCLNILLRLGGGSLQGATEMSGYVCALGVGLSLAATQLAGKHIEAGSLAAGLSPLSRRIQDVLVSAFCLAIVGLAAFELASLAAYLHMSGEVAEGFDISFAFTAFGLSLGLAFYAAVFVFYLLGLLKPSRPTEQTAQLNPGPALAQADGLSSRPV